MDNSKLFYVLNLSELQRQEIIRAFKDNSDFKGVLESISRNNPVTGLQAPLMQKYIRQWISEVYLTPFWIVYNFWKYPKT